MACEEKSSTTGTREPARTADDCDERSRDERRRNERSRGEQMNTDWRGKFDEQGDLPIDETVPRQREARALLGSLLRPYRWPLAALAVVVVVENVARLSVPLLVQKGIDDGIPPLLEGGPAHTLLADRRRVVRRGGGAGDQPDVLPAPVGTHRSEGAARTAPAGVPPFRQAGHRVSRPLHLGSGGESVHQRRRGHPGHAGDRVRQLDHRGAHAVRHRGAAGGARRQARPDVSGRVPGPGAAGLVVPQRVVQDLPRGPRDLGTGHRAVRRDDDGNQGGAGVSA